METMARDTFSEVMQHYQSGFDETDRRRTGRGRAGSISFDEADELFRSWIDEKKWPYQALIFDPRVFTFIFEKASRLLGNQLRGNLVPREGGDVIGAAVNNEMLQFQWDQATHDGTMLAKWALMDINTRKYGASFGLCKWWYETSKDGKVIFDGPDMTVLNNRDCAHAYTTSIETCNWFDVRRYVTMDELKRVNDISRKKPVYKNLDVLEQRQSDKGFGDARDVNWISRNRSISGLSQPAYGDDPSFRHIEIVTEYRKDEWITFAPKFGVVIREVPEPYGIYQIPITMLRYYMIDDDLYGISEIEPVKPLQKAINALLCEYIDEVNMKLYTPIAIGPGVRQHTLEWGKGAKWIMTNPMSDFRLVESNTNAMAYFNQTYSALVASMMTALGESSLGVSNIDRSQPEKTAAEVKMLTAQRNSRDNFNQIFLAEAIERQMKLWYAMNQKMIFQDPSRQHYVLRIAGKDAIRYFQDVGFDKTTITTTGRQTLQNEIQTQLQANPTMDITELELALKGKYEVPQYPVESNGKVVPKFQPDWNGQGGVLYVEPSDLLGNYDFVADVQSMGVNATEDEKAGRSQAISTIITNPTPSELLAKEGVAPKFKDLFVTWLEDRGLKDADRYFGPLPEQPQPQPQATPGAQGQPGMPPPAAGATGPAMPQIPGMNMQLPSQLPAQGPMNVTNIPVRMPNG